MKKQLCYMILAALFLFGLSFAPVNALHPTSDPWTMYRHDLSHSGFSPSSTPDSNNTQLWQWSKYYPNAPVVVNGMAITSYSNTLYSLDETTGVALWGPVSFTGAFYGSPAVVGDRFYIGTNSGYMYCVNVTNGEKIWEYQIQLPGQINTSPSVANGKVYFTTTNNFLYAVDAITGLFVWRYTAGGPIQYSSPAVDGTWIYFGCDDGKLYAINDTGSAPQKKWTFPTNGMLRSSPTISQGKVFIGSYYTDHAIFSVDKTTGSLIWKFQIAYGYTLDNALAFSEGLVFFTGGNQKAYALYANATAGNYTENDPSIQLWSRSLGASPNEPTVADGKVFVCSGSYLYALNVSTGQPIWWYKFASTAYVATIADGRLFVNHYNGITCLGNPFPPVSWYYTVNVVGQDFIVRLDIVNATPSVRLGTSGLMALKKISYNLTGIDGTIGTSNITIPKALLRGFTGNYVTVDGGLPSSGPILVENDTHTSIYFTYEQSFHTVEITGTVVIPEFPAQAILPLLTVMATAAIVIARRKLTRN